MKTDGKIINADSYLEAVLGGGEDMVCPTLPLNVNPYECPGCRQFKYADQVVCDQCLSAIVNQKGSEI